VIFLSEIGAPAQVQRTERSKSGAGQPIERKEDGVRQGQTRRRSWGADPWTAPVSKTKWGAAALTFRPSRDRATDAGEL
jgi:hypothetical protein